ncbi:MAG: hypothetical protein QXF76_00900 [Candidatus Anstonellales archaeon]
MAKNIDLKPLLILVFLLIFISTFVFAQQVMQRNSNNQNVKNQITAVQKNKAELIDAIAKGIKLTVKQKISLDDIVIVDGQKTIMAKNMTQNKDRILAYVNNVSTYNLYTIELVKNKLYLIDLKVQMLKNICYNSKDEDCDDYESKINELENQLKELVDSLNDSTNLTQIVYKYRELNQMTNNLTAEIKLKLLLKYRNATTSDLLRNRTRLMMHIMCKQNVGQGTYNDSNDLNEICINPCSIMLEQIRNLSSISDEDIDYNNITLQCNNNGTNCRLLSRTRERLKGETEDETSRRGMSNFYLKIISIEGENRSIINLSQNETELVIKIGSCGTRHCPVQKFAYQNNSNYLNAQVKCLAILNSMFSENAGLRLPNSERTLVKEMINARERIREHKTAIINAINLSSTAKIMIKTVN